jgi:D-sedoheptulose 7-phosphate isomerase
MIEERTTSADGAVSFAATYLEEVAEIARQLDAERLDLIAQALAEVRNGGGRLFIIGVGGGAGHASHAVNDFRKIARFEAYTPTDNVSELTARINDDGWEDAYAAWLEGSRISAADAVLVFSVGGGDPSRGVSVNLVRAIDRARAVGARVFGIVGRDGGYTARMAESCVVVSTVNPDRVTAHTEGFQAVLWHLLVFHPAMRQYAGKWESLR